MPGRPLPRYLAAYLQHRQAIEYGVRLVAAVVLCVLFHFF